MKPTRKKNIENREMYQHLKLSLPWEGCSALHPTPLVWEGSRI